jgi:hypothetical protein
MGKSSRAARAGVIAIKQHRFELTVGLFGLLGVALWGGILAYRLAVVGVPEGCVTDWLDVGAAGREHCAGPMSAWSALMALEGGPLFGALLWVPFLAGLLVGVPIVARELEMRTAHTAWSLYGSRLRWLATQALPLAGVLTIGAVASAAAASVIAVHRAEWGQLAYLDIGLHGLPLVIRVYAAFGIGLLIGSLAGRSLSGFVLGALMLFVINAGIGWMGSTWLAAQPPQVIEENEGAITTGWWWRDPAGELITDAQAKALVPPDVAARDVGLAQAIHSIEWLDNAGHELVPAGVTDAVALGWVPYYTLSYAAVAATTVVAAGFVVHRRRPG